jgi:hypothetical protein
LQLGKKEREQVKQIKLLIASKQEIPAELLISIPDSQKIWEAEQAELASQKEKKEKELKKEEDIIITTGATDHSIEDLDLQLDYLQFSDLESSSVSGESELYNPDNDYSWQR